MDAAKYQETVYQNMQNELRQIDMVLKASQMTLKACPVTHDKLITDDVYVSSLNMTALKEILKVIQQMSKPTASTKRSIWTLAIAGAAVLASLTIFHKIVKH